MRIINFITEKKWMDNYGLDVRSLSLFRVVLGLVVVLDIFSFSAYLDLFYTDAGVLPAYAFKYKNWYDASVHALTGNRNVIILLLLVQAAAALAFAIGFYTRISGLVSFVLLLSLFHRFPAALNNGDHLLGLLLFWSWFLPLDEGFSWGKKRSGREVDAVYRLSPATFAYCLQIALIYLMGVLLKNNQIWLYDASAVYYTLNLADIIRPFWAGKFTELSLLLKAASIGTMLVELLLGLAILMPFYHPKARYAVVIAGIGMHAAFFMFMDIGMFTIIDMVAFIPFIPSRFWNKWYGLTLAPAGVRRPDPGYLRWGGRLKNAFVLLCALSIVLINLRTQIKHLSSPLWVPVVKLCQVFDIYQTWAMFSVPAKAVLWMDIVGTRPDQQKVKITFPDSYVSDKTPEAGVKMYRTHRIQLYVDAVMRPNYPNFRRELMKWLCTNSRSTGSEKTQVDSLTLLVYRKENSYLERNIPVKVDTLAQYCCRCNDLAVEPDPGRTKPPMPVKTANQASLN